jgi:RNA polymerase sigma-70 factor (sigma-E family)
MSSRVNVLGGEVCLESGRERDRDRDGELAALFNQHYDSLRRLAFVMIGDGPAAEEVVMEAFVKAMSRWRLFRKADYPGAYLRQIVVNLARSKMRRKAIEYRVNAMTGGNPAEERPGWDAEAQTTQMDLWSAVTKLPDRQRVCIVLRYLEDLTEPEVAEVLDCPVGTVKSQLSRGRAKLAEMLGSGFLMGESE